MSTHVVPVRTYLLVFAALMLLTAATAWIAFQDLGPLNNVAALGIAALKATLVVLFFMHVKYSPRLIPLAVTAGVFWLLILIGLSLCDYLTRGWLGVAGH